jgi:hypothetical protein
MHNSLLRHVAVPQRVLIVLFGRNVGEAADGVSKGVTPLGV